MYAGIEQATGLKGYQHCVHVEGPESTRISSRLRQEMLRNPRQLRLPAAVGESIRIKPVPRNLESPLCLFTEQSAEAKSLPRGVPTEGPVPAECKPLI